MPLAEVWDLFHKTGDTIWKNILIENYRGLVRSYAKRVHSKLPVHEDLDDLSSAGILGLMDAIDKFDPSSGVKFETYCFPRIRGSILDELRSMDWVPKPVRARTRQLSKATSLLKETLYRNPTEEEIASELGLDNRKYKRLLRDANTSVVSLDAVYSGKVNDNRSPDPIAEAEKKELQFLLTERLDRSERLIIHLYYQMEMTMEEIGRLLGLFKGRISQVHSSIISKMKEIMECD